MIKTEKKRIRVKPLSEEELAQLEAAEAAKAAAAKAKEEEEEEEGDDEDEVAGGKPAEIVYSDIFVLLSDAFSHKFVKGIELPKILFKKVRDDEQAFSDKSVLMIYLDATIEAVKGQCHKQLFKAAKKGPIKLEIKWLSDDGKEELSHWKFGDCRIQGIDFGTAVYKRPDINSIAIEVSYENLEIDGVCF
ncbi:MAG: hypothetical protein WC761_00745 [Candidatus Paceibacterota bacterium]|jgi:hypothetical protein